MSSATNSVEALAVNEQLLEAVVKSVTKALGMGKLDAKCVGVSRVPTRESGTVTGMIGLHGRVSGFLSLNMSEKFAVKAVGAILHEKFDGLCSEVIDGAGELTNIIAGGVKSTLSNTDWMFSHITVPSVIVGQNYSVAYAQGLEFLQVTFEHSDRESLMLNDRLMHVSMSLLRL